MSDSGWLRVPLNDVVTSVDYGISEPLVNDPSGLPVLRMNNLQDGRPEVSDLRYCPGRVPERLYLRRGDVLFNRTNSIDLVGKSALWTNELPAATFASYLVRLNPNKERILPEYLVEWLQHPVTRQRVRAIATVAVQQVNVNPTRLCQLEIDMPANLGKQRHIVEVLDALGEKERAIEAAIAKARLIRQEVARQLLSRAGTAFVAVEDVAVVGSGSTPSRSRSDYWTEGAIPWVRTAEICFDVISETSECITRKAVAETGLRVYPPGSVLLAMYGEGVTRGRSAVLGTHATVNQATAAIVCDPQKIDYRYLYYWLEGHYEEIRKVGHGSNQTNLNGALVAAIRLPLPPVEEQGAIVAPIEAFDAKLRSDALELEKLRTLRRGVLDNLLSGKPCELTA
ncbi:restriction endonuclease subunit S [Streptomyces sp. HP-A2021]|uniref:restriction endonuclease subunit S n=1 Tax=Streptomyces sp. HP-A2021 TaxID=2927875 RepID=UPI001FAECB85|nr:restriction endonuclease subunit S [Streptomyces sp. HP-A2021]UOB10747.1 restriction endonuclease subunit S [Streptomyces sp. HP-A2021]